MRLQKFLAQAGVASRRKCEEYILQGKVRVNGEIVDTLGTKVDWQNDVITYNKKQVTIENKVYIAFYKPPHVICTSDDPQGRQTIQYYFEDIDERLYTVGRLDYDSEGIILVTNDGEMANKLMHPRNVIKKKYYCVCKGIITPENLELLRDGIMLDEKKTAPAIISVLNEKPEQTQLLITITEGRNRQVRRMFESVDNEVLFLRREEFASINITGLAPGKWRNLTQDEIESLNKTLK